MYTCITISLFLLVLFIFANAVVYLRNAHIARKINSGVARNVEKLIIGDWCETQSIVGNSKSIVYVSPSFISETMTILMVKRLFSLLDEGKGTLIIIRDESNKKKDGVSIFGIPFLHENTLADMNKLWLWNLCKFPFLFNIRGSLMLLCGYGKKKILKKVNCPIEGITEFCNKRNIKLEFYTLL